MVIAVDTKARAFGRWRSILPALGVPSDLLTKKAQPCPFCAGRDRFVFDDREGNGDYFCRRCGPGDGFNFLQKFHGWDFAQACREVDAMLGTLRDSKPRPATRQMMTGEDIRKLWEGAAPIKIGDHVDVYLCGRSISLPNWPRALRFADRWKHAPTQKYLPCMFALFQAPDGEVGTVHRTYLADITPNRMFLPCKIPVGGAIRLCECTRQRFAGMLRVSRQR